MFSIMLTCALGATQTSEVEAFHRVDSQDSTDVHIRVDEAVKAPYVLTLTGDEAAVARVKVRVEDGTLFVRTDPSRGWFRRGSARLEVSVAALESIDSKGSGDIEVTGLSGSDLKIQSQGSGDLSINGKVGNLRVEIKGSGDIDVSEIEAKEVKIESTGSGDIELKGQAEAVALHLKGSGDVDGTTLRTQSLEARLEGSGDATVCATGAVRQRTSGSGDVNVRCSRS